MITLLLLFAVLLILAGGYWINPLVLILLVVVAFVAFSGYGRGSRVP